MDNIFFRCNIVFDDDIASSIKSMLVCNRFLTVADGEKRYMQKRNM